jgi:hypothetical protein
MATCSMYKPTRKYSGIFMSFSFRLLMAISFFSIDAKPQPVAEHHGDTSSEISTPINSVVVNVGGGYVRINNIPDIVLFGGEPSRFNSDAAGFSAEVHYCRRLLSFMSIGGMVSTQLEYGNLGWGNSVYPAFPIAVDLNFGPFKERLSPIYQISYGYTFIPGDWGFNSMVRLFAGISWPGKRSPQLLLCYQMIDVPHEKMTVHALCLLFGWRWAF